MGWRPATGRNPPIEAVEPAYPLGPRFAGPRQGLAGGRSPPLDPQTVMDTLYHSIYSDPGGPVNRCGTTVCVPARSGRFPSCPQFLPPIRCASLRGSPSAVPVAIGPVGRVVGWLGRVTVFSRYSADVGLSIGNRGAYSRPCSYPKIPAESSANRPPSTIMSGWIKGW